MLGVVAPGVLKLAAGRELLQPILPNRLRHPIARQVLPLLAPYVTVAVILRAIDAFRIFEVALVLAGRVEPVLGTFIWSRYAPPTSDPYTAAAGAVVLFLMILGFVSLYLRVVVGRSEVVA